MLNFIRFILLVLISIQISSLSFIQGGIVAGVMQLPELIEHFDEHQQEDPSISWLDFLDLHYGNSEHIASGDSEHDALPLNVQDANSFPASSVSFEIAQNTHVQPPIDSPLCDQVYPAMTGDVCSFSPYIFHPPS